MRPTPEVPGRLRLHDLMQHYCVLKFNSPKTKRRPHGRPNNNIVLSHRFARGSRRGSDGRPESPRLGAERPPRRAEPRTRGEAGRLSEPRHRQVRPSRQGGRNAEKRPLRAERPVLPRPGAAVLSARWGLTAEFGMGSGDPPLHGSARGRRSRGNRLAVRGGPGIPRATLAVACARHVHR